VSISVFVPDAHARACVAAIRSLGRAGYNVHAGSSNFDALGLKSRFANHSVVYPPFIDPLFLDWMRDYVARHDIKMIVPTSAVLEALKPSFEEFKPLLPVTADEKVLFDCFSKSTIVSKFINADPALNLMKNHPQSSVVDLTKPIDFRVLPKSKTGYYLKSEKLRPHGSESATSFAFAENGKRALAALNSMASDWEFALVQEACSGFQVGVSVLIDNGKVLAVSCVRDCHQRPHSRGTMSLRQSCWFPEIADDTINRLSYLNWQGCAMGEYRYDESTHTFKLIEINFRFWQYLHLDLFARMDYPLMQAQWFLEGKSYFDTRPKLGVVCRDTWPGEVAQLVNEWRRDDFSLFSKIQSFFMFFVRSLNPYIRSDFFFPGDRTLYFQNFVYYLKSELNALYARLKK